MEIKAIHFDMKSMIPTAEYALTLVDELAEVGINAVLVEFEDKFPFDVTRGTHHPCAWTKEEFRRFADKCREKKMEMIPLLQSIGHLDYLLKYPKFRDLRDGGPEGSTYQWCLALEESYELWCKMVDELLELFPETVYFHIGADECRMNVPCEKCFDTRFDLYIKRVARCCEYIQQKNKKVVLWDDVFRKYGEEKFALLPKGVISCVWMYGKLDTDYIGRMAASGVECWGASCIQAHKFFHAMSPQEPKMRNVDAWGRMHEKYPQFTGHIGTIWGRNQCQSPFNSYLPPAMFMASYLTETLNNGIIQDRDGFMTRFGESFFGMKLDYPTMINYFCYEPGYSEPLVTELKDNAPRHRDIAEIWYGLNYVDQLLFHIYSCFSHNDCMLTTFREGMAPREMTNAWLERVNSCKEDIEKGLAEIRPLMVKYFPEKMWDEFIDQRFRAKFEQNEYYRHIITCAAAKWNENLRKQ
jgi:hypothetical protein